jgi:hypothetical protein
MQLGRQSMSTLCVLTLVISGFLPNVSAQGQEPVTQTSDTSVKGPSGTAATPNTGPQNPIAKTSKIKIKAKSRKKVRRRTRRKMRRANRARKKKRSSRQRWPTRRPKKLAGQLPPLGEAPYSPGERLVFRVQMFGAVAGNAILAVGAPTMHRGRRALPFAGFMRSSEFLNKFYPVQNRLVVLTDQENMLPLKTDFYVRENKKKIDYHTTFRHKIHLLDSLKKKNGRSLKRNFTTAADIHEPLGSIYAIRRMDLQPGNYFQRYIWDGRKERLVDIRVVRRETVTVPAGVFDTLRIDIQTRISGGFIRSTSFKKPVRKGTIWIAQDRWKTPVKMVTPTKIGDAEALLIRRYIDGDEAESDEAEGAEGEDGEAKKTEVNKVTATSTETTLPTPGSPTKEIEPANSAAATSDAGLPTSPSQPADAGKTGTK